MGIEDGSFDPNEYRLETETKNRNAERSISDKLLGRNKTTSEDITVEEAAFSPEEQDHAISRTYAVAERLRVAKEKKTTEKDIAQERAGLEAGEFDQEQSEAQKRSQAEKIMGEEMGKTKSEKLARITEWEESLKKDLDEAKKLTTTLPESIRFERDSARMQPEHLAPAAYERVKQLEEQLHGAQAIVSAREQLLSVNVPKEREAIENMYNASTT